MKKQGKSTDENRSAAETKRNVLRWHGGEMLWHSIARHREAQSEQGAEKRQHGGEARGVAGATHRTDKRRRSSEEICTAKAMQRIA